MPFQPTHIVLLMGMNDCGLYCLLQERSEQYDALKKNLEVFQENISLFCQKVKDLGAELTLCTTTPYDEYQNSDGVLYPGGYALLMGYANFIRDFAKRNGYPLCDYHPYLCEKLHREKIIDDDRIHPNDRGHYYIAKRFLEFQGFDLGDEVPVPEDVNHWHSVVKSIRNTITAECFFLKNSSSKDIQSCLAAVAAYPIDETSSNAAYFKCLKAEYPTNKIRQKENIQFAIDFMRNTP